MSAKHDAAGANDVVRAPTFVDTVVDILSSAVGMNVQAVGLGLHISWGIAPCFGGLFTFTLFFARKYENTLLSG
jgi:hypothetical protein